MAPSKPQKKVCTDGGARGRAGGGVIGAIVPATKKVDQFPLMSYVAKNCNFDDDAEDSCLEEEEALKAANDRRLDELLKQAAVHVKSKEETSGDEAERKKALELLHSLEHTRNQEETWKISQPKPKNEPDYRGFLHPLNKKNDKEEAYFSGTRKVKPLKERKRSRSDEVVMLDDGKLVPKDGSSQLPIEITIPFRSSSYRPRVPSVGLPFTPVSPPPTLNNPWMQKNGSDLFSNVRSSTVVAYGITCDEEEAMALAIAESIRTAKQERERTLNFRDAYNFPCDPLSAAKCDEKPIERPPPDPLGTMWLDDGSSVIIEPPQAEEKQGQKIIETNNNSWDYTANSVERGMQSNLDQRPKYSNGAVKKSYGNKVAGEAFELPVFKHSSLDQSLKYCGDSEAKSSKGPSSLGFRCTDSVSQYLDQASKCQMSSLQTEQDDVLQHRDRSNQSKQATPHGEKNHDITTSMISFSSAIETKSELSTDSGCPPDANSPMTKSEPSSTGICPRVPKEDMGKCTETSGSSVDSRAQRSPRSTSTLTQKECYSESSAGDKPKSSRMPTSMPALVAAMKSFADENVPYSVKPKDKNIEDQEKSVVRSVNESDSTSSPGRLEGESVKVPKQTTTNDVKPQLPKGMPDMPLDTENSLSAQVQMYQMLLMQQAWQGMPPILQNQNLGGVNSHQKQQSEQENGTKDSTEKKSSGPSGPASGLPGLHNTLAADILKMSNTLLNPGDLPGMPNTFGGSLHGGLPGQPKDCPGGMPGLPNNLPGLPNNLSGVLPGYPGGLPGLPNDFPGGMSGLPNNLPGLPNNLPGGMPGLPNNFSGLSNNLSGLTNNLSGVLPGYPGGLPGLPNNLPGGMPGLPNNFPGLSNNLPGLPNNLPGMPNNLPGMPNNLPGGLPGLPNNLPGVLPGYPGGLPGLPNNLPVGVPGLPNLLPGLYGMPNMMPGLSNNPSGLPGFPNNFPGVLPGFMTPGMLNFNQFSAPMSTPGMGNCNSFGGMAGSLRQPGSTPLVPGKGRGRLSKP